MTDYNKVEKSRLRTLLSKGKKKGFLTYSEVNEHLPENIVDPDQVEGVMQMLNDMGVQVFEDALDANELHSVFPENLENREEIIAPSKTWGELLRETSAASKKIKLDPESVKRLRQEVLRHEEISEVNGNDGTGRIFCQERSPSKDFGIHYELRIPLLDDPDFNEFSELKFDPQWIQDIKASMDSANLPIGVLIADCSSISDKYTDFEIDLFEGIWICSLNAFIKALCPALSGNIFALETIIARRRFFGYPVEEPHQLLVSHKFLALLERQQCFLKQAVDDDEYRSGRLSKIHIDYAVYVATEVYGLKHHPAENNWVYGSAASSFWDEERSCSVRVIALQTNSNDKHGEFSGSKLSNAEFSVSRLREADRLLILTIDKDGAFNEIFYGGSKFLTAYTDIRGGFRPCIDEEPEQGGGRTAYHSVESLVDQILKKFVPEQSDGGGFFHSASLANWRGRKKLAELERWEAESYRRL